MPWPSRGARLDGAGDRVAEEQQVARPESSRALTTVPSGRVTFGAGRDVEPGLDDAVVAERDAEAGVGAEQAALADADPLRAAAGEGAHDRRAAADVGAVADDDALADAALDHRGAERAGVEVDEALVHDRGARGEVGAEAHAVGVGDAHAGRHDVVGHPRELVDAERPATGPRASSRTRVSSKPSTAHGPCGRPHDVGQHAEDAVEVDRVGLRPAGARAGAAAGRRRRRRPAAASRSTRSGTHLAAAPRARRRVPTSASSRRGARLAGAGRARRAPGRVPGVEDASPSSVHGGQAVTPGGALAAHGGTSRTARRRRAGPVTRRGQAATAYGRRRAMPTLDLPPTSSR